MTTFAPSQRRGEKWHSRFAWSRSRAAPHVPSECSNPSRAPITHAEGKRRSYAASDALNTLSRTSSAKTRQNNGDHGVKL
jgi:hypothetical protein